jgi:DnaJ-class molecular chaperone
MNSDIQLLEKLKAREELAERGYVWQTCASCLGAGQIKKKNRDETDYCSFMTCYSCRGRGGEYKAPIMR